MSCRGNCLPPAHQWIPPAVWSHAPSTGVFLIPRSWCAMPSGSTAASYQHPADLAPAPAHAVQRRWSLGLHSTALRHRLSVAMSPEDNRLCRPLLFAGEPAPVPAHEPETVSSSEEPRGGAPGECRGRGTPGGPFCVPPKRSALALPAPPQEELLGQRIGTAYIDAEGTLVRAGTLKLQV